MTTGLEQEARTALERFVQRARRVLEEDLAREAEGRFGIHVADGEVEDEDGLHLDPAGLGARRDVVEILEFLRREEPSGTEAVGRLIREASFTHLNRLVAVRIAEAIHLLPESLAKGAASAGFKELLEAAPLLAHDSSGGYWRYLRLCGDELASDLPQLFDPRNPLLELAPSASAFEALVQMVGAVELEAVWDAPDALGWTYQFFNSGDERKAMRDASTSPRDSRELAVRNQFFTPRYVVDFLVQNSLGRCLLEANPESLLPADLPLMVDPPTISTRSVSLDEIAVLDPACGSGHFLLAAYDVLERAFEHVGVTPRDAAPRILRTLWGIDIDPRCTQVAAAALSFRARCSCPDLALPRTNVICARSIPATAAGLTQLRARLPVHLQELIERMIVLLDGAPILGTLLQAEMQLTNEARGSFFGGLLDGKRLFPVSNEQQSLTEAIPRDEVAAIEEELLGELRRLADETTSSTTERMLAAEVSDAVRFVEALRRRFDVVLMNPPFGEPVASTKTYLKAAYPWIPSTNDLFALFVGRGLELCKADGYVGAITSHVGMFLTSFEEWRQSILLGHDLIVLADLGEGVMEQAMVEAAAYVLASRPRSGARKPIFIRAVAEADRAAAVLEAVTALGNQQLTPNVFTPDLARLGRLVGSPVAYWVDPEVVDLLASHDPFEPTHGVVRKGLETGDDFRFVRAWWEVANNRLTRASRFEDGRDERAQLARGAKWAPIVKGGASQPWFSPFLFVLDWENDGEQLRNFRDAAGKKRSFIRSTDLYFQPGFSWTRRAPRLVPYVVPAGCIPSGSRYQAFPAGDPYVALGLVASNIASAYCRFYGEKFLWPNFLVGNVKTLPIAEVTSSLADDLAARVREVVQDRQELYRHLEPFREFLAPVERIGGLDWDAGSLIGESLEDRVAESYGLSRERAAGLERDMNEALAALGMDAAVGEPDDDDLGDIQPWSERLVSYLVGVSFGRWDVRIGREPTLSPSPPDPFDPPPAVPPGMLVDGTGRPTTAARAGYPLSLPPDGVLLDEPGHRWDIEAQVLGALRALGDVDEAGRLAGELGRKTLREYFRRQFFKDHLKVYSKGRRKAPIYWPLTVPSGRWGIWLYAPSLCRETLYTVAAEALRRERFAETEMSRLERERISDPAGRGAKVLNRGLDEERTLAEELRRFREEAERVAGLGWEPDLDDGIVLCAAPLADLFPMWREPAQYRKELRAGEHPWSTVSKWAGQL